MAIQPGITAPIIALVVDGGTAGDLRSLDGLRMEADIVANDLGPDNFQKKHVSNIRWTPGVATVGLGMGQALAAWLTRAFASGYATTNGSVTMSDASGRAALGVTFQNAMITRCTFPALDAASKDPGTIAIEFTPEQVRMTKGDGSDMRGLKTLPTKPWLCSGFKVEIGTLPCSRVSRVESMSWACAVAADQIGIFREPTKHPAKVTVPDLTLTIGGADRQPWVDAATAWFVNGQHLEGNEMQGAITLLAPDGSALAKIALGNLGFRSFQTLPTAGDLTGRFSVSFYVESMAFQMLG